MHRRNVASAPISSIKEEEDVPTSTPITMRPPKKPRSWLNLETVRLAVPVLAGVVVLVLVLAQLPYFHRCPGPVRQPAPRSELWAQQYHEQLVERVQSVDENQGTDVVLYGDSILHDYENTFSNIFDKYFNTKKQTATLLAVGADQVSHLRWRIMHGEIFEKQPPGVIVVHIGTNDLGAATCHGNKEHLVTAVANGTFERISSLVSYVKAQSPSSKIVLVGLLPRGDSWPPDPATWNWPSMFTPAIEQVNTGLKDLAASSHSVQFVDCGSKFIDHGRLNSKLMPDGEFQGWGWAAPSHA
eukprot:jgi/Astpho2/7116/Aster-07950